MTWVTIKGVKMDRTACAWLIRRFIEPEAEFIFVEKDEVQGEVDKGARPFHNYVFTGTPRENSGFQELLAEHGLEDTDPALVTMGQSVRRAERAGWAKDGSENYGLWAIANGITTLTGGNDAEIIERMLPVYDALYAYCQERVAGGAGWTSDR
jgi:hypothetical protein